MNKCFWNNVQSTFSHDTVPSDVYMRHTSVSSLVTHLCMAKDAIIEIIISIEIISLKTTERYFEIEYF